MERPKIIVFASGSPEGGGSGFQKLVENTNPAGALKADIVSVVSNYPDGGVEKHARNLGVPFEYFPPPWTGDRYKEVIDKLQRTYDIESPWVALSGWLKRTDGLDPKYTFNIHPGPLAHGLSKKFGGKRMYGHFVHEAIVNAYKNGEVFDSAVSMHFVTDVIDGGPVFFHHPVPVLPGDTADSLGSRVNAIEHQYQSTITNLVVHKKIQWNGKDPSSLVVPSDYRFLP
jgi:phosphoribosylglycinamide formyltransferase 1